MGKKKPKQTVVLEENSKCCQCTLLFLYYLIIGNDRGSLFVQTLIPFTQKMRRAMFC